MSKLIALFYLLLSLAGCDQSHTVVTHSIVDGVDVIDSQIEVTGKLATFRCLRSNSGECHYTVLPQQCAASGSACRPALSSFSMREGNSVMITALPKDFASCVTAVPSAASECAQQLASAVRTAP
ncbi:hypothetical protein DVT68_03690 [Dyella solisilvae]|uniref:Uncharacterized protein n=1 Tax=Dyella solisilvae TaxID=1920168 RepID=A0A370KCV3_9GAMM|nr:hypothetical protein [Dyella solisilvae]RDI99940.1 hypothetical protein DVT68_03690 [Dyella solisilvae]